MAEIILAKAVCEGAALVTRGLSLWDPRFSATMNPYADMWPAATGGYIANCAMQARIAAHGFSYDNEVPVARFC